MGSGNYPVQSIRRRHIDAAIKQPVDESRVLCRVNVLAIVAVIMDRVSAGKVNLKHRSKPLNNRVNLSSTKNVAQAGNGGVADSIYLLINRTVIRPKQV